MNNLGKKVVRTAKRFRVGNWDCSNCGGTRISGRLKHCPRPGCGQPRDPISTPSERIYLPADAEYVTDPEEEQRAALGPNWYCSCGEPVTEDVDVCPQCGKKRGADATVGYEITYTNEPGTVYDQPLSDYDTVVESPYDKAMRTTYQGTDAPRRLENRVLPGNVPTIGRDTASNEDIRRDVAKDAEERQRMQAYPPFMQPFVQHKKPFVIAITSVVAVILAVLAVVGITKVFTYYTETVPGTVTVSAVQWERSIEVERLRTFDREGWDYPYDARVTGREQRVKEYETVVVGTEWVEVPDGYDVTEEETTEEYECGRSETEGDDGYAEITVEYCERDVTIEHRTPKTKWVEQDVTEQQPVKATWYFYQEDEWVTERWLVQSGGKSDEPAWPDTSSLRDTGYMGWDIGDERVGDETREARSVDFTDSTSEKRTTLVSDEVWRAVSVGDTVPASYFKHDGSLRSVDWDAVLIPLPSN